MLDSRIYKTFGNLIGNRTLKKEYIPPLNVFLDILHFDIIDKMLLRAFRTNHFKFSIKIHNEGPQYWYFNNLATSSS